jgi:hypothetical protein
MKAGLSWIKNQSRWNGWRVVAGLGLLFGLYLLRSGYHEFAHDSAMYWALSGRYFRAGHFALLDYNDALRGYLLPLLLAGLRRLAQLSPVSGGSQVKLLGAALAALSFGWLGPALWRAGRPTAPAVPAASRLLFGLLGFALWRDYFNFPLTDFLAPALLGGGVLLVLRPRRSWLGLLLAGAAWAAMVNMRPVYLAALPLLLLLTAAQLRLTSTNWATAAKLGVLALGAALVLLPQALINQRYFGRATPLVLAQDKDWGIHDLYLQKLSLGVTEQKLESSIAPDYPAFLLRFRDEQGAALLRAEGITEFGSRLHYLSVMAHHPLAFAGLLSRHLFNGLDVQYPTPYLRQVYVRTWPLAALNYTLLFVALLKLALRGQPRLTWRRGLLLAAWLAPALATLPMSMECRFLLPLHLLLLAEAVFGPAPRPGWRALPGRQVAVVLLAYALFLLGCFSWSAATQRTLELGPRYLFGPSPPPQALPPAA